MGPNKAKAPQKHTGDFTTMDADWDALEAAALAHHLVANRPGPWTPKMRGAAWKNVQDAAAKVGAVIGWDWWNLYVLASADMVDVVAVSNPIDLDPDTVLPFPAVPGSAAWTAQEAHDAVLTDAELDAVDLGGRIASAPKDVAKCDTAVMLCSNGRDAGRYWVTCGQCGIVVDQDGDSWHDAKAGAEAFARAHRTPVEPAPPAPTGERYWEASHPDGHAVVTVSGKRGTRWFLFINKDGSWARLGDTGAKAEAAALREAKKRYPLPGVQFRTVPAVEIPKARYDEVDGAQRAAQEARWAAHDAARAAAQDRSTATGGYATAA